eukprot:579972-Prorocentrum_lima.AAC.1
MELIVYPRLRRGGPVEPLDGLDKKMGRLLATINSAKSWAVDMGKPDLLEAANDAYSYWTE